MTYARVIVRWLAEPVQQSFDDAIDVSCVEIAGDRVRVTVLRASGDIAETVRPRRDLIGIRFGEEQRRCCGG